MTTRVQRLRLAAIGLALSAVVLLPGFFPVQAGFPHGAFYSPDASRVFWFIHVSDPHIGARGSTDADRLRWIVTTGRSVIGPEFIVATGDLTDSTNGNLFGYPDGPYQAEWDEYKNILAAAGADDPAFFHDIPGNHDAYNDQSFAYYRANSVQGRATGGTQVSWTRQFDFGKYHLLGVNTADNTGAPFSLFWPWGDHAGLDETELTFIRNSLSANADADLTFVFGHHPVTDTGVSDDTWLYYGHQAFISELGARGSSLYNYGHTHRASEALFDGDSYTGPMPGDGVHYYNVASLGKSSASNFSVVAVDCNGVSSVTQTVGTWPVVLITAPVDAYVGSAVNPYAYTVPAANGNPIRALIFDPGTLSSVSFRVDGAVTWTAMERVSGNAALWAGSWNAASVAAGEHTIEVRAVGTTTRSNTIRVQVTGGVVNHPPAAASDSYTTQSGTTLVVSAPGVLANDSDPDGDPITAALVSDVSHGVLTLAANGGFTYAPASGYSGTDAFTYVARDSGGQDSNVVTVMITVSAATDTVNILSATYTTKRKLLAVEATSSAQPAAVLTVEGYGPMTYKKKSGTYVLQVTTSPAPASVMVTSSEGGTATKDVTGK